MPVHDAIIALKPLYLHSIGAMTKESHISTEKNKAEKYTALIPQIRALAEGEDDIIACLANIIAALKSEMGFYWVGCYFVKDNELVLGPFQGVVACSRIAFGKGVCGTAWKEQKILIVDEVDKFPGHIACNAASKSEIVLPAFNKSGKVSLVLDADSKVTSGFNDTDQHYLQQVIDIIEETLLI